VVGRATDYPMDIAYFSDRRRLGIPSRRQVSFTAPIVRADTRPRGSGVGNYPGVQKTQVPKDGGASTYITIAEPLGGISRVVVHPNLAAESGDKVVGGDEERNACLPLCFSCLQCFCVNCQCSQNQSQRKVDVRRKSMKGVQQRYHSQSDESIGNNLNSFTSAAA